VAPLIRSSVPRRPRSWRDIDLRWLAICLVGVAVSAMAAWAVLVGGVPLDVLPADTVFALACAVLVVEWFFAAVLVAIFPDRAGAPVPAEPGAPAEPAERSPDLAQDTTELVMPTAELDPAPPAEPVPAPIAELEPAPPAEPVKPAEPVPAEPVPVGPVPAEPVRPAEAVQPAEPVRPALMVPVRNGVAVVPTEVGELQERIDYLTAALTLTAAADNLEQVGAIAQQALADDIRHAADA
jgi:hypothetical protein